MKKKYKRRNPLVIPALLRSGAGKHPNRKKAVNKKRCRGKVTHDERN